MAVETLYPKSWEHKERGGEGGGGLQNFSVLKI